MLCEKHGKASGHARSPAFEGKHTPPLEFLLPPPDIKDHQHLIWQSQKGQKNAEIDQR